MRTSQRFAWRLLYHRTRLLRVVSATAFCIACWGSPGFGADPPQYSFGWGQLGTGSGEFDEPTGVAVDSNGNVFVVDRNNDRVQKFDASGSPLGNWGSTGAANGEFDSPRDVAVDSNDDVYVTDGNNDRVQKFTNSGTYITQWGTSGTGNGEFLAPRGIAIDASDNVYVTEDGFASKRVQKFTNGGAYISQWGSFGTGNGQFTSPRAIAAGGGHVYVTDALNNSVQKFTDTGSFVTKWGANGSGDGEFSFPLGIRWEPAIVYVVDSQNHRVQAFDEGGSYLFEFGSHCELSSGTDCVDPDGGGPLQLGDGQFHNPQGVFLDGDGNVYVTDRENHRVAMFEAATATAARSFQDELGVLRLRAYPNPAGSSVRIDVRLASESIDLELGREIDVRIYDVAGRLVRTLHHGAFVGGQTTVEWDGRTESHVPAPRGVYVAQVDVAGERGSALRIVLTR